MKHTPGPWVVGITLGGDGWPVYRIRDMNDPTDVNERFANASLIEAAPEMMEALERVHSEFIKNHPNDQSISYDAFMQVSIAVTKATGEN